MLISTTFKIPSICQKVAARDSRMNFSELVQSFAGHASTSAIASACAPQPDEHHSAILRDPSQFAWEHHTSRTKDSSTESATKTSSVRARFIHSNHTHTPDNGSMAPDTSCDQSFHADDQYLSKISLAPQILEHVLQNGSIVYPVGSGTTEGYHTMNALSIPSGRINVTPTSQRRVAINGSPDRWVRKTTDTCTKATRLSTSSDAAMVTDVRPDKSLETHISGMSRRNCLSTPHLPSPESYTSSKNGCLKPPSEGLHCGDSHALQASNTLVTFSLRKGYVF